MVLRRVIFIQAVCAVTFILIICEMSVAKSIASSNNSPLTELDHDKICANFSVGNLEKKEFYSPNYPNNYPNNTKCTLQITANFGQVVKLDFRDQFRLEDSPTCEYDRLEIRDGPYGYSPLIKRNHFCGSEFPNIITSSDRYLWLQFVSDESIEYGGFRAVYSFVTVNNMQRTPTDECVFRRSGPAGYVRKIDIEPHRFEYSKKYELPIDCIWIITTDPGKKIYMSFIDYKLACPNDCEKNYIEIYPESRNQNKRLAHFCGTTAEPQTSTEHVAHVRLFTDLKAYNVTNFTIHYTAVRELEKGETCDLTEFNCMDQTCVHKTLQCDDEYDCKYRYDEDQTVCVHASVAGMVLTSEHMITILVVFFALVVAMCASICISCYNKVKERQLREREYKERRSKEASVEGTVDRTLRGQVSPDRAAEMSLASQAARVGAQRVPPPTHFPDDGDDESSDGCYVPEVDLSGFHKHPNGGGSIPRGPDGRSVSRGGIQSDLNKQQYPFISHSTDSLQSETIIAPAPPPVPMHLKDRRDITENKQPQSYRIVGGKAIRDKTPPAERRFEPVVKPDVDSISKGPSTALTPIQRGRWPPDNRPGQAKPLGISPGPGKGPMEQSKGPSEPRTALARGPLEAGAPKSAFMRNPGEFGLPIFGPARVNPDGPRGPLAKSATNRATPLSVFKAPDSYNNPYRTNTYRNFNKTNQDDEVPAPHQFKAHATIESSDRDSSRPDSVDSSQSAPDVIAQR